MVLNCSYVRACVHLSVHTCVHPETLLTRYLAEYLTHFHQIYTSVMHHGTEMNASQFGVQRSTQRSRSRWNKVCWKQHFWAG